MFVTTAGRTNQEMMKIAMDTAKKLEIPYIPRRKKSIQQIQQEAVSSCLVVGKERIELFDLNSPHPFFFHPNSAMFRIKRLLNGERDPFVEAAQLSSGMSLLDCTLGLASDAIVASFVLGTNGQITGIEGHKYLAYVVNEGLHTWNSGDTEMNAAMRRINVIQTLSLEYLQTLPSASIDCVYFDPMFEEKILESDGIKSLGQFAIYHDLDEETIREALRVSKKRVILKDHFRSSRFDKYGFNVIRRKSAKFHFGYIEK